MRRLKGSQNPRAVLRRGLEEGKEGEVLRFFAGSVAVDGRRDCGGDGVAMTAYLRSSESSPQGPGERENRARTASARKSETYGGMRAHGDSAPDFKRLRGSFFCRLA